MVLTFPRCRDGCQTHETPGQFFTGNAENGSIAACPPLVRGIPETKHAHFGHLLEHVPWELTRFINLFGPRNHFIVHEHGHAVSDGCFGVRPKHSFLPCKLKAQSSKPPFHLSPFTFELTCCRIISGTSACRSPTIPQSAT